MRHLKLERVRAKFGAPIWSPSPPESKCAGSYLGFDRNREREGAKCTESEKVKEG